MFNYFGLLLFFTESVFDGKCVPFYKKTKYGCLKHPFQAKFPIVRIQECSSCLQGLEIEIRYIWMSPTQKLKLKFLNFGIFRIKRILKQYAFATILNWRNGLALKQITEVELDFLSLEGNSL